MQRTTYEIMRDTNIKKKVVIVKIIIMIMNDTKK